MAETTRFAPSPTGRLHLGHAHAALVAAAAAGPDGRFLLRLEDIDHSRCRPAFAAAIIEDLGWLGLTWPTPVRRQSDHGAVYAAALDRLDAAGLLYPCFCTRRDIADEIARAGAAPHGPDPQGPDPQGPDPQGPDPQGPDPQGPGGPLYPGTCRRLDPAVAAARRAAGTPFALRLRLDAAIARTGRLRWHDATAGWQTARPELFGDVVLARKDTPTSYHLAVTVDDALQGVTLVTRGVDLFAATHVHRLLQALLDLPVPRWAHHRLLTDPAGRRLAKRDRAQTIDSLRAAGHSPDAVRRMAGCQSGFNDRGARKTS